MVEIRNVIEVCNIINDANTKLCKVLGEAVELRLVEPEIPGLYVSETVIQQIRTDYLKNAIVEVVCVHFMISPFALRVKTRDRNMVDARKISALLLHEYVPGITDAQIGTILNFDRSTASASRTSAADLILTDKDFKFKYGRVLKQLTKKIEDD